MAGNIALRSPGWTQVLSSELNSLASAAGAVQATGTNAAYDNTGNSSSCFWADFELRVTFGTGPTAGTTVDVYLIPLSSDGSGYVDGSATVQQSPLFVGGFVVRNVTTAQVLMFRGVPLPNDKFLISVVNNTNQAFPSSGSTVKIRPYGEYYN
jgi:hypothetical protein